MGAIHSERVTFLTTPEGKAQLVARASELGVSLGEFIRSAMEGYDGKAEKEERELAALIAEVQQALPQMSATLERSQARLQKLHEENQEFLAQPVGES